METSKEMIEQIAAFEGCKLTAYKDIAGIWTIGVGHTGPEVKSGMTITKEQAMDLLRKDLASAEKYVNALNKVLEAKHSGMMQKHFDALVSLVYNCGSGAIRSGSTMRNVLIERGVYATPYINKAFMLWCKYTDPVTGKKLVSKGLQKRRAIEAGWYGFGAGWALAMSEKKITDIVQWATT